eukprot:8466521-Ditylum_brightwellii.AAC.1
MPQRKGYLCLKVTFLLPSHLGQKSVVGRESVETNVVVGEDVVDEEVTMPEEGEEEKKRMRRSVILTGRQSWQK